MKKDELRKIYLSKRKNLSHDEKSEKSSRIAERFFQNFYLTIVKYLHCFISIERFGEIETSGIFRRIWREFPHIETFAPRVNSATGEIESLSFSSETNLVPGNWRIPEPAGDAPIAAEKIDLVIVPLLCFDRKGSRVGYGKGYYDKFLSRCRPDCLKIGVSYFEPIELIEDTHEYDVKLDFCVTPENTYDFSS